MAANEYYNSTPSPYGRRNSNPPSPIHSPDPYTAYTPHHGQTPDPYTASASHHAQPSAPYMSSSLEDSSYGPYADHSQQSISSNYYAAGGGGREHEPSAYSDDIPLRQNPSKRDSDVVMHDPLPDDPAIVDRPTKSAARRRRNEKQGFFSKKIPWVVYTFTLIQVAVFIAELAKNGG